MDLIGTKNQSGQQEKVTEEGAHDPHRCNGAELGESPEIGKHQQRKDTDGCGHGDNAGSPNLGGDQLCCGWDGFTFA